jgi:hypothetical protein
LGHRYDIGGEPVIFGVRCSGRSHCKNDGGGNNLVTYKRLFYELTGSVDAEESLESAGPVTKDLPD